MTKWEVTAFTKIEDEPTEVERLKVYATDPDDACGSAIEMCRDRHGADVDVSIQKIAKLHGDGNAAELELVA